MYGKKSDLARFKFDMKPVECGSECAEKTVDAVPGPAARSVDAALPVGKSSMSSSSKSRSGTDV